MLPTPGEHYHISITYIISCWLNNKKSSALHICSLKQSYPPPTPNPSHSEFTTHIRLPKPAFSARNHTSSTLFCSRYTVKWAPWFFALYKSTSDDHLCRASAHIVANPHSAQTWLSQQLSYCRTLPLLSGHQHLDHASPEPNKSPLQCSTMSVQPYSECVHMSSM